MPPGPCKKLQFLRQSAADDLVVLVQPHGQRFTIQHGLPDVLLHQSVEFFRGSTPGPSVSASWFASTRLRPRLRQWSCRSLPAPVRRTCRITGRSPRRSVKNAVVVHVKTSLLSLPLQLRTYEGSAPHLVILRATKDLCPAQPNRSMAQPDASRCSA